jgi:hypothetical protein
MYPVGWNGTNSQNNDTNGLINIICGSLYTHGNINFQQGIHVYGAMVSAGTPAVGGNIFMAFGGHITYVPGFAHFTTTSSSSAVPNADHMVVVYSREIVPPP